jgi:hypothetical protein
VLSWARSWPSSGLTLDQNPAYKKVFRRKKMKKLQQFFAAAILTLALALSASAGDILCPGVIDQPPPQQSSVTGDMSCPGVASTGEISGPGVVAIDPVTEITLSLFQSVLFLF